MTRRARRFLVILASRDRWLVSYADFMTLLFALFVVLFAAARQGSPAMQRAIRSIHGSMDGRKPSVSPARPHPQQGLESVERELRQVLGDSLRRGEIGMQNNGAGLIISLRESGFFDSGEAVLLPGAAAKIHQIGAVLEGHGLVLRVEGHSDDQPIHTALFRSNWELSAARAMTVLLLLVDSAHYDPRRISMAGYGPYQPVADNRTAQGRQLNRRVDLVVIQAGAP